MEKYLVLNEYECKKANDFSGCNPEILSMSFDR